MKEVLLNYANYNLWANAKLMDVLKGIDASLLDKEIKSSFPSLRKTMHHIWSAEEIWYKRLHGESPASLPEPGNDFPAFAKQFSARSQSFIDLVNSKDAFVTGDQPGSQNFFQIRCSYKDTRGNSHHDLHWQMIMHCMNHSTFHRGQIVTMLREHGITAIPVTDMIAYYRGLKDK